jgi:Biotin-protein ligase, N terminal
MKSRICLMMLVAVGSFGSISFASAQTPQTPVAPKSAAKRKTVALVYDGPGACEEGCAQAAADSATAAGFQPIMVKPDALSDASTDADVAHLFENAAVWVQPGGYARNAYEAMSPKLRDSLKKYIANGGGYVGFCAGAFITTNEVGTTGSPGLGIFPGKTAPLGAEPGAPGYNFSIEKLKWGNKDRNVYYEGGPYMYDLDSSVEVVATYNDGKTVAAARTHYGNGRVFISGPHPEAPAWWSNGTGIQDSDGSDIDLAVEMIRWSAGE